MNIYPPHEDPETIPAQRTLTDAPAHTVRVERESDARARIAELEAALEATTNLLSKHWHFVGAVCNGVEHEAPDDQATYERLSSNRALLREGKPLPTIPALILGTIDPTSTPQERSHDEP